MIMFDVVASLKLPSVEDDLLYEEPLSEVRQPRWTVAELGQSHAVR